VTLSLPASMWGVDEGTPSWWAVQTTEWMEHRVARWLRAMRLFGVHLPQVFEKLIDRPGWKRVPLFREYVFVRMGNVSRNVTPVLRVPGTVALIGPITDDEMASVMWLEFEMNRPGVPQRRPRKGWRRRRS
jgi:transcription antitermination factor NusG